MVNKLDTQQIVGIVRNQLNAAEGSLLPPPQKGKFRVPFVTNLRTLKITPVNGGTQFILGFNTPTTATQQLDHYAIYVAGVTGNIQQFAAYTTTQNSPVTFTISDVGNTPFVFKVQTVLKNGLFSDLNHSPTCTGTTLVSTISGTITLAKLTGLGSNGSLTITNGLITAFVDPT